MQLSSHHHKNFRSQVKLLVLRDSVSNYLLNAASGHALIPLLLAALQNIVVRSIQ